MKSIKTLAFLSPIFIVFLCLTVSKDAMALNDSVVAAPVEAAAKPETLAASDSVAQPSPAAPIPADSMPPATEDAEMPPMPQPSAGKPAPIEILPAKSLNAAEYDIDPEYQTHPPIALTPDKSELLRLDEEALTVIVGNPLHLSVLADSPKTLILVGRAPGATHFLALDADGEVIMQRHVIVASPKEKYVRIRSTCAAGVDGCQATRVYYCPDMCHEVLINSEGETSTPPALPTSGEQQPGVPPAAQQPLQDLPPSDEPS